MERRNTCKVLPQSVQPLQRRRFFELTRVIILHIYKIMKFPIYRKVFHFVTEPGRQASGAMKVVVTCNSLYYGLWEATMLKNKSCLCFGDFSMESECDHPTHSPKPLFPLFHSTNSSLSSAILQNPECYTWLLANVCISLKGFSHSWDLFDYLHRWSTSFSQ